MTALNRRPEKSLTAQFVKNASTPGKYFDGHGLFLRVDDGGGRYWVQRIVIRGKRREIGLGPASLISLVEARATAIRATRKWGKMVMVGEGGAVTFNPSPDIIHEQKTIYGSWVTSTWLMEELVERLVRWNLHPEDIVTHRFSLDEADSAYSLMASGRCGKVAVCPTGE